MRIDSRVKGIRKKVNDLYKIHLYKDENEEKISSSSSSQSSLTSKSSLIHHPNHPCHVSVVNE